MNYVFLDTNIFLHCLPIEEIDFCKLLNVDAVQIVITLLVIQELNKVKDTGRTTKLKNRARNNAKKLSDWFKGDKDKVVDIRSGVTALFYMEHGDPKKYNLDAAQEDYKLIASILLFKEQHRDDRTIFISNDDPAGLVASFNDIEHMRMPEEYCLSEEPDPIEKENRELKCQVAEYENARPKISLSVNGQPENNIALTLKPIPCTSIPNSLECEEQSFPAIMPSNPKSDSLHEFIRQLQPPIRASEYERYEEERQKYFIDYGKYLKKVEHLKYLRVAKFCIEIKNIGSAPATDLDLLLHFHAGLNLFETAEEFYLVNPPDKPVQPRNNNEIMFRPMIEEMRRTCKNSLEYKAQPKHLLEKTSDGYNFSSRIECIKHYKSFKSPFIYIVFNMSRLPTNFSANYEITVAELPKQITGKLNFRCVYDDNL